VKITKYPLPELKGIVLEIDPSDFDLPEEMLDELLTHEFLHWILHPGLASNPALEEAIVERFTSEWYGAPRSDGELRSLPWDWSQAWGSCGFRVDDFAHYEASPAFQTAYIIGSRAAFQSLAASALWSVATTGLQAARRSRSTPTFIDLLREAHQVISAEMLDAIVASFAGRRLRPGVQGFFLPCEAGTARLTVFRVTEDRQYRLIADPSEPLAWSNQQFLIEDAPAVVRGELDDGAARFDWTLTIKGQAVVDVRKELEYLTKRGLGKRRPGCDAVLSGIFLGHVFELRVPPEK